MASLLPPTAAEQRQKALDVHRRLTGKLSVVSKEPVTGPADLALLYTPGVAEPCREIAAHPETVYEYTGKGNLVAVISDGTAVLGLGDIGPEAGLPVMEGKALLFKEFAGIDAFPLVLGTKDPAAIIAIITALAPSFGGINLEDISAPRCFEIEKALQEALDIPVFHDDQHGTAVVVLAALTNAAKKVGKDFYGLKVVVNGAGAAGTAITRLLLASGLKDIVVCDRAGVLLSGDPALNPAMAALAAVTNPRKVSGSLSDALVGADVFIGVSAPKALTGDHVRSMAPKALVFAMANPEPEISPKEALAAGAALVATGRSDFPNQINNVLAFPGIFRGALVVRARKITEGMKLAASRAIAALAGSGPEGPDAIVPSAFHRELAFQVAFAVATAAVVEGVAGLPLDRSALIQAVQRGLLEAGAHRTLRTKHHGAPSGESARRIQERIGEGLVRLGLLSQERCEEILGLQSGGDKRLFGEIALALGFLDFDTLIDYLRRPGGGM
jgi:malate dehydrogenase (oxaloacetate-decarboxylating)